MNWTCPSLYVLRRVTYNYVNSPLITVKLILDLFLSSLITPFLFHIFYISILPYHLGTINLHFYISDRSLVEWQEEIGREPLRLSSWRRWRRKRRRSGKTLRYMRWMLHRKEKELQVRYFHGCLVRLLTLDAHIQGYRGWDFSDDCMELLRSVALYSWFPRQL